MPDNSRKDNTEESNASKQDAKKQSYSCDYDANDTGNEYLSYTIGEIPDEDENPDRYLSKKEIVLRVILWIAMIFLSIGFWYVIYLVLQVFVKALFKLSSII